MYVVIVKFIDLEDDNHLYLPGDTFPREDYEVTKKRLKELSTSKNKRKQVLIRFVKVEEQIKLNEAIDNSTDEVNDELTKEETPEGSEEDIKKEEE